MILKRDTANIGIKLHEQINRQIRANFNDLCRGYPILQKDRNSKLKDLITISMIISMQINKKIEARKFILMYSFISYCASSINLPV